MQSESDSQKITNGFILGFRFAILPTTDAADGGSRACFLQKVNLHTFANTHTHTNPYNVIRSVCSALLLTSAAAA